MRADLALLHGPRGCSRLRGSSCDGAVDHPLDLRGSVDGMEVNGRMLLGEDAEDFVGESLADGGHILEIEEDLSESLKSGKETLGLGTGD